MKSVEAFPLHWPDGYPRTKHPERSRFQASLGYARDGLVYELRMLGAKDVILSTNIPLRRDGFPYATYAPFKDVGVAVYFKYNGDNVVLACDKWDRVEHNMQAVRKAIEAIRGLDRWGVSDFLKRAFTGFAALPDPNSENWWEIIGVTEHATKDEVQSAYKRKLHLHHPDKGGDPEQFHRLQIAWDKYQKSA